MANADRPSGLTPIGTLSGADWQGQCRRVVFAGGDAVACFIGDRVKLTGTADATGKLPVVAQCELTDPAIGVLVGLEPDGSDEGSLSKIHRLASTARTGLVAMGGDILYSCQEDSDGGAIGILSAGLNAEIVVGTGSAVTGISGSEIDSSGIAGTSSFAVRVHHVIDRPGNALGVNADWAVSLNDYQGDRQQTGI
tara:strand:+ start:224 stop:808 length:585 start_codon:yes stop_codon:yes gene_type:complete